ncbi:YafY family transcriptional regulator [Leptotrichia sp. OH3620_COT-345]|uniref:helix-turn-helix transcriptional regulator n=1 Tax=Leptotrichia sp. OH3620_COT-345 TaxID=2491048 RepID=UPI000F653622|nr:YafY family protein [Leptotrichia sp. OH3620_COT-345]RRD39741.1 YafY family transcriptional regulator [Leptotrichia sp. OH3620_COT-345]
MQINRLFETVYILLNKKNVTAKELADHFEVSIRTVYRDIEALMFAGIPVYSSRGKNGGIKLLEDYVLDKSIISKSEQNDILYALQSLKAANYPEIGETLSKLNTIFNKSSVDWIEVDFSGYNEVQKKIFENIKNAILNRKVVNFEYYNSNGIKSKRSAEPLKLWFKIKAWYLYAFCRKNSEMRTFKITRIKNLQVTEEIFERLVEKIPLKNEYSETETVKVIFEADKSQAYRIYDEFSQENIKKKENGNFEVVTENVENEWLYGYLLSFGENIKIFEPLRIKNILSEKIEKMKSNYK